MSEDLIKKLEQKIEQIEKHLAEIETDLWNAKLERAKKVYGIDCGVIVISNGKKYKVTRIDVGWDGRPWVKGYGLKKNGTWSKAAKGLFDDWELEK